MKRLLVCMLALPVLNAFAQDPIYVSPAFKIYPDRVEQGNYTARALHALELESNYQSPENLFQSADIVFKFAINGRDNEMLSGKDHHFTVSAVNGEATTPVIVFGQQVNATSGNTAYLEPNTKLTIKLDMRAVMKQFNEKGFYTTHKGDKIYKEHFKGVYVAGNTSNVKHYG